MPDDERREGARPERPERWWGLRRGVGVPESVLDAHGRRVGQADTGLSDDAWRALARRRWALFEVRAEVEEELASGRFPEGVSDALRAYRSRGHVLVLATRRLTVVFSEASPREARARLEKAGLRPLRAYGWRPGALAVDIPFQREPFEFAEAVHETLGREDVRHCEPETLFYLGRHDTNPPGPPYSWQWQWSNLAHAGCDVHAEPAWEVTLGAGVRIAVLDVGFDWQHSALLPAVLEESCTFDSSTGDRIDGRENLLPDPLSHPHGTSCAGMAAAHPPGEDGLRGAAPAADLFLVSVEEWTSGAIVASAFWYAAFHHRSWFWLWRGSDVISFSRSLIHLGGAGKALVEAALDSIRTRGRWWRGTPVLYAVENLAKNPDGGGGPNPLSRDFVACHAAVTAVGKSDSQDQAPGHAQGPQLAFVAPGIYVYAPIPMNAGEADTVSGTSFAAPAAAGIAALVLAVASRLRAEDVRRILCETCDRIGPLAASTAVRDDLYGHGRLNAERAVQKADEESGCLGGWWPWASKKPPPSA